VFKQAVAPVWGRGHYKEEALFAGLGLAARTGCHELAVQGWQDSQRAVPTRIQRQAPAQPRAQPRCRAEPHQPARPVGRWAPGAARRPTSASLSSSQSLAPSGYARTPPCAENASRSAISASSAPKRQAPGRPVHEACPGFNLNLDGVKTHADQYETGTSCLWRRSGSGGRTSSPAT